MKRIVEDLVGAILITLIIPVLYFGALKHSGTDIPIIFSIIFIALFFVASLLLLRWAPDER